MQSTDFTRLKTLSLDEVLPFIRHGANNNPVSRIYESEAVRMSTATLKVFAIKGVKCAKCGMEGLYFAIEKATNNKQDPNYHLSLYGVDKDKNEVLFTKDHILPKAKGGKSTLDNLQTMCEKCNTDKGCKVDHTVKIEPQKKTKLIIKEEDKLPIENFLSILNANVTNPTVSDHAFREFVKNTLVIVKTKV